MLRVVWFWACLPSLGSGSALPPRRASVHWKIPVVVSVLHIWVGVRALGDIDDIIPVWDRGPPDPLMVGGPWLGCCPALLLLDQHRGGWDVGRAQAPVLCLGPPCPGGSVAPWSPRAGALPPCLWSLSHRLSEDPQGSLRPAPSFHGGEKLRPREAL